MRRFLLCLALALVLAVCCCAAVAEIATVRVTGQFGQTEARSMLQMINDFRTGSDAWYWNSDNATKTECAGLQPLVYDYGLEKVAMQRAIEVAMSFSHTRPNGESCSTAFSLAGGSFSSKGENIAAGYGSATSVFVGWQETDENYGGQGHRRNMLNGGFNCVGIGHVIVGGYHYWTQEFGYTSSPNTAPTGVADDNRTMDAAVDIAKVKSISVPSGDTAVEVTYGDQITLPTQARVYLNETWGGGFFVDLSSGWTTKDSGVAAVSGGRMAGVAVGSTTLEASALGQTLSVSARVYPVPLSRATLALSQDKFEYGGVERKPGVTASDGGRTLVQGTDYTLSYMENINAGEAIAVASGMGNYTGNVSLTFTIAPASLSGATLAAIEPVEYTGKAIKPAVSVNLGERKLTKDDYTVAYSANTKAGKATVTVKGKGNYRDSISGSFTILPVDVAKCAVADIAVQRYTGKAIVPAPKVTLGGKTLKKNRDYTLRFSDNKKPGDATITITGKGNYGGSVAKVFKIDEVVDGQYRDATGWYKVSASSLSYIKPLKSKKTLVIPDEIKVKGKSLKVTAIEPNAFKKDTKLVTITLGANIRTIGKSAFASCSKLANVKGGGALTTIGASAFQNCGALKAITLPVGVKKIGASAFKGCKSLKTITIKSTGIKAANVGSNAFKGISSKAVFKCPKKQLKAYMKLLKKKGAPSTAKYK